MAQRPDASTADALGARHIVDWIEARLGPVASIERLARWRPSWNVDVSGNGSTLALYVRGERGADFPAPFPLEHEVAVHDVLERHGVLVPHVHGLVSDGPVRAIVMDRIEGRQGLAFEGDDATKASLARSAIEQMYTMHRIPVSELDSLAVRVPSGRDIVVSELFRRAEDSYVSCGAGPDPVIEFLRRWVWHNAPHDVTEPALVAHDAGQFLHHEGRLTAMIDFEMAHLGDPYMDLAALRLRDTMEPWGDLRPAYARYEELSGVPLDYQRLRYFEVSYATITPLLQYPVLMNPGPETDYMAHLTWYVDNVRYALDVLAERMSIELEPLDTTSPNHDFSSPARQHLVRWLRQGARSESRADLTRYGIATHADPAPAAAPAGAPARPADDFGGWRQRCAYRLARHLARLDELGGEHDRANRHDIEHLVGERFESLHTADAALVDLCRTAGADRDVELVRLFDRRFQRLHQTLGPADSLIVRHPPLQPLG